MKELQVTKKFYEKTVFLTNCRVTAITFSYEARSPILLARKKVMFDFITSIQPTDQRSRNILGLFQ